MGSIRLGLPTELVLLLQEKFALRNFVETGTFLGGTSTWAAKHFEQVITIENSRAIYDRTVAAHGQIPNIKFMFGNSRDVLQEVVPVLQDPALFWLDGHWCGPGTYGEQDECPLLDELALLNESNLDHFILIDDARLFTSPPPLPNTIHGWPSIAEVFETIQAKSLNRYCVIFEDVIIVVPQQAKELVANWCQRQVSITSKGDMVKSGLKQMRRGLGLIVRSRHL